MRRPAVRHRLRRLTGALVASAIGIAVLATAPADAVEAPGVPVTEARKLLVDDARQRVYVSGDDKVLVYDFAGNLLRQLTGHPGAAGMAILGSTLYVAESSAGTIGRIGLGTVETNGTALLTGLPNPREVIVANGSLWTTTGQCDRFQVALVRIDPSTGATTIYGAPFAALTCPVLAARGTDLVIAETHGSPATLLHVSLATEPPTLVATVSNQSGLADNLADVDLSDDGTTLYTASAYPYAGVAWNLATMQDTGRRFQTGPYPTAVDETSAHGGHLVMGVTANGSGTIQLFDRVGGLPVWTLDRGDLVLSDGLQFSADGTRVFALSMRRDRTVDLSIIDVDAPGSTPTTLPVPTTTTAPTTTTTTASTTTVPGTTTPPTTAPPTTAPTTTVPPANHDGELHPIDPARVFDSRGGAPISGTRRVQVAGRGGVPATGVRAVALNVTVTDPRSEGYLSVYPAGGAVPNASNLNYRTGQTVPNMVIVGTGAGGQVELLASTPTHVIVDVVGWFGDTTAAPGGRFHSILPARWFDTRVDPRGDGSVRPLGPAGSVFTSFTGGQRVDAAHVAAVALNVTATGTTADSYLTVAPAGTTPNTSSLNWPAGATVPNAVVTKVSADTGRVAFTNATGSVDVLADVFGLWDDGTSPTSTPGSRFVPVTPVRVADTRTGYLAAGSLLESLTHVPAGGLVSFSLETIVPSGATAAVVNITAVGPRAAGFLSAFPLGEAVEEGMLTSVVNFVPGDVRPNLAIVPIGLLREIVVANGSLGALDIVVDVSGYFA